MDIDMDNLHLHLSKVADMLPISLSSKCQMLLRDFASFVSFNTGTLR